MGTTIRAELSSRNIYRIPKHRYYELKHYCLQYPDWVRRYNEMETLSTKGITRIRLVKNTPADPVSEIAVELASLSEKMGNVYEAAIKTDKELHDYILKAVTEGRSYDYMRLNYNVPCGRNVWYELYRRFFFILNQIQ